jgi:hypothetical protein
MNLHKSKLTVAGALLAVTSLASAHGGDHAASSLYHFLTSPDHVTVFSVLAMAALGSGTYLLHKRLRAIRLKNE